MRASMAESSDDRMSEEELLGQMTYVRVRSCFGDTKVSGRVLLFAATDTTSSSLTRILHLLALHPNIQDKLRTELKEACKDNKELTHDQLVSLPILEAVCRETLRVYVDSFVSLSSY